MKQMPYILFSSLWQLRIGATWINCFPLFSFAASIVALIIWRLWRFTVLPMIHPQDAKELPYWIPYIGHTFSFFMDSDTTFTRGRMHFCNSRSPYAITVAGTSIYVLTSAADAAAMSKNTRELVFDEYVKGMMASMGCSEPAITRMWEIHRPSKTGYPNPLEKSLGQLSEEIFRKQLHPGTHLTELQDKFLTSIHQSINTENLLRVVSAKGFDPMAAPAGQRPISLLAWTQDILLEGATNAFFGKSLLASNPDLLKNFSAFDERSWQLSYKIPRFWSRKMQEAKQESLDALTSFFRSSPNERSDACWLVRTMESEMRQAGLGEQDIAANLMMAYWVINGNAWKVCFWMMAYLVEDQALCSAVRSEVAPYVTMSRSPNELGDCLDRCPQLVALYQETLRVVTSSVSVRNVVTRLRLGGKFLQPGNTVLIPYRQILMDEQAFGPNASEFDPTRFLKNPSLAKSPSFRPFGNGTTHCPGRFLAQKEILTFVGVALSRFNIFKAVSTSAFPQLELRKPCLGIMAPVKGDDIAIIVTPLRL